MKIYIPTFRRVDNQITFDNIPDKIKENVIMVVQEQERDEYKYDCEYLVVGDNIGIAKTREIIYPHAGKTKDGMIDDDIVMHRRNTKYYNQKPNMEKSKRIMTKEDWEYWFSLSTFSISVKGQVIPIIVSKVIKQIRPKCVERSFKLLSHTHFIL